jgi:phosphoserine phosphatase RsbU/P
MEALLEDPDTAATTRSRVLIADDQSEILEALALLLRQEGFDVESANSATGVLRALEAAKLPNDGGRFDLLLMDMNYTRSTTSGREGLDLVSRIRALDETLPVVVMTAWGSIELAVEAMQKGVNDFVLKPWDNARLVEVMRAQIAEGRARRVKRLVEEEENAQAREVQQALLPKTIPQVPGCEISAAWQPARTVGGDYFDVSRLAEDHFALCIADVMGKGVPAALLMSNLQAAVKAMEPAEPRQVSNRLNDLAFSLTGPGRLISLFYAHLDLTRNVLTYSNAGQNPPILVRRNGDFLRLTEGGAPLGAVEHWAYEQGEVSLASGDRILLYTDGVSEAVGSDGEEFGEDRLLALVRENRTRSAADIQRTILESLGWSSGRKFEDDATLLVVAVGDHHAPV